MLNRLLIVAILAVVPQIALAQTETLYPLGLVTAKDSTTYIVDLNLRGVWKLADRKLSVFAQAPKKLGAPLYAARCIALDQDGNVLVGDSATREVYRLDAAGAPTPLTKGGIGIPMSIAVDHDGAIFVADLELHRICKVPHAGGKPEVFAEVLAPRGLAFDSKGNLIVLSTRENQIHRFSTDGKGTVVVKGRPFDMPHNIAIGNDDAMYVTDGVKGRCLWKVATDGKTQKLINGDPLVNPVGVSFQGDHLLIVDPRANAVFRCDLDGKNVTKQKLGAAE